MLFLLKSVEIEQPIGIEIRRRIVAVLGLVSDLLHHAGQLEERSDPTDTALLTVLDQLNRVWNYHCLMGTMVEKRELSRSTLSVTQIQENLNRSHPLLLAVQSRLVKCVRARLRSSPALIRKDDWPLLDYALDPRLYFASDNLDAYTTKNDI